MTDTTHSDLRRLAEVANRPTRAMETEEEREVIEAARNWATSPSDMLAERRLRAAVEALEKERSK